MPPWGLSAGLRKARELGRRTASLAFARAGMVEPRARYQPRAADATLILQRGPNPSTDYYLRPRLEPGRPSLIADLDSDPQHCAWLGDAGPQALMVVFCRYADERWLAALEARRARLARVALFMDDDLPAVAADAGLPRSVRGKVALHFSRHAERLSDLCSELWVSTPALAQRYRAARVLPPLPEADPPEPIADAGARVAYHGTDVHGAEQAFVLEVARRLAGLAPQASVELVGPPSLARRCTGLGHVEVTPQLPWPAYLERQSGRSAAICLAPLFAGPVNDARAPVKAFDAARLGAAALYADAPAYRSAVRDGIDGLLLPMDAAAWAEAIAGLLADPARRLSLARAARERLVALRAQGLRLPAAPGA